MHLKQIKYKSVILLFIFFQIFSSLAFAANLDSSPCDSLKQKLNKNSSPDELKAFLDCGRRQAKIFLLEKLYHFKYENDEKMQAFIRQLSVTYYNALRQCQPGKYSYVTPFFVVTATIEGRHNNKCLVIQDVQRALNIVENWPINIERKRCEYDSSDLSIFTSQTAEALSDINKPKTEFFDATLRKIIKIDNNSCKKENVN